jgi:hypothetical protein
VGAVAVGQKRKRDQGRTPGPDADFAELGGDSLGALKVCKLLLQLLTARRGGEGGEVDAQFGTITGPLAPTELLKRPRLADYCRWLGATHALADDDEEGLPAPELDTASSSLAASGDDEEEEEEEEEGGGSEAQRAMREAAGAGNVALLQTLLAAGCTSFLNIN